MVFVSTALAGLAFEGRGTVVGVSVDELVGSVWRKIGMFGGRYASHPW